MTTQNRWELVARFLIKGDSFDCGECLIENCKKDRHCYEHLFMWASEKQIVPAQELTDGLPTSEVRSAYAEIERLKQYEAFHNDLARRIGEGDDGKLLEAEAIASCVDWCDSYR